MPADPVAVDAGLMAAADAKTWLVYSREHNAFWRPNAAGYTFHVEAAGRYTESEAQAHCQSRSSVRGGGPSEFMVPAPEALQAAEERGAERMRERAANHLDYVARQYYGDDEKWAEAFEQAANEVRALPTDKET